MASVLIAHIYEAFPKKVGPGRIKERFFSCLLICLQLAHKCIESSVSTNFRQVIEGCCEDTDRLGIEDIDDLLRGSWTASHVAIQRANAVVTRRLQNERDTLKEARSVGFYPDEFLFRGNAVDSDERAIQARNAVLEPIRASHSFIRSDYSE
ncbi:hypothetical protein FGB62_50g00 [Gracilaria domingensis]|nr:hypothetical protein FGB62_50g00 [Gracilaria domingensis]